VAKVWILSFWTDVLSKQELISLILDWAQKKQSKALAFSTVHMAMEAYDDPDFAKTMGKFDLVCADGRPIYILQRLLSSKKAEHVYGPWVMGNLLEVAAKQNLSVGLFGGTEETLMLLMEKATLKYPGLKFAFYLSPPFRAPTDEEAIMHIKLINESGADILFVGLGCPKQEKWVAEKLGKINMPMLAVGAAFDFIAGSKKTAPNLMRVLSLEWLFRLVSEPRRLWKRYLILNPRFIGLIVLRLLFKYKVPLKENS